VDDNTADIVRHAIRNAFGSSRLSFSDCANEDSPMKMAAIAVAQAQCTCCCCCYETCMLDHHEATTSSTSGRQLDFGNLHDEQSQVQERWEEYVSFMCIMTMNCYVI
jgi:hypothetical protein